MSDNIVELRGEILEAEKSRYDLLKWKLVLVSGLGAAGLGIGAAKASGDFPNLDYLLCLIPLVCIYVDVLCLHMNLRIMVIGGFLRCSSPTDSTAKNYEEFTDRLRNLPREAQFKNEKVHNKNIFALEDWALRWSTVTMSVLVVLYASVKFSCPVNRWWVSLIIMILPGIVLAVRLPNILYSRLGSKLGSIVILILFAIPYWTITDSFYRNTAVILNVKEWLVFLTAGMLGLTLTGFMRYIYIERCCAIKDEVNKKCSEMVDNEPASLTISTNSTLTVTTKE